MSSTNKLRKHVQHAHPHLTVAPGKNGKAPNADIMNANHIIPTSWWLVVDQCLTSHGVFTHPSSAVTNARLVNILGM